MPTPRPATHAPHAEETRSLASAEGLGTVTQCACGTISLNVQALSLRLDLDSFARLLLMCSEAMGTVERELKSANLSAFVH